METIRDLEARWDALTLDEKKLALRERSEKAMPVLQALLVPGMKFRGVKAECGAREATFIFSHWEGRWIVSKSGRSVSPSQVYSVNGAVQRF